MPNQHSVAFTLDLLLDRRLFSHIAFSVYSFWFQPNVGTNCRSDFACKMTQVPPESNRNRERGETIDAYKQIQHMLDADTFSRYKWSTISISYTITWTLAIGNCSFGLIRKHCFGYMYAHLIAYCAYSKLFALLQCFPCAHRERESGSINWDKHFDLFNWNPDEKPVHSSFQLLLLLFCLLFFLTVLYFFHALASPLFFRINIK